MQAEISFKKLHYFNLAMLGKQGWRLLSSPSSFVAKVYKTRHFLKTSFVNACVGHNLSYAWQSIMTVKDVIIQGSRVQMGNGQKTLIGKDLWLPI